MSYETDWVKPSRQGVLAGTACRRRVNFNAPSDVCVLSKTYRLTGGTIKTITLSERTPYALISVHSRCIGRVVVDISINSSIINCINETGFFRNI